MKSPTTPNLGIPQKDVKAMADSLNQLLSDQHVLYIKMRNFHWNLVGPSFVEVHEFIEKLYNNIAEDIDQVAERINQLGQTSLGSMQEFLKNSILKESEGGKKLQEAAITELAIDNDFMARKLRELISEFDESYNDPGTVDLFTRLLQSHEKSAWMLRRYIS